MNQLNLTDMFLSQHPLFEYFVVKTQDCKWKRRALKTKFDINAAFIEISEYFITSKSLKLPSHIPILTQLITRNKDTGDSEISFTVVYASNED